MTSQTLSPDKQLPIPHDMQLPMTHWKMLRKPTFQEKYGSKKWIMLISLVVLLFIALFLPVPYYAQECPQGFPCSAQGWQFGYSLWDQLTIPKLPPVEPQNTVQVTPSTIPTVPPTPTINPADVKGIIAAVKSDLAKKLNIDSSLITISSIEAVAWSDTSLGCPKPGFGYAEVVTPGYNLLLEYKQVEYSYHTDTQEKFVECK